MCPGFELDSYQKRPYRFCQIAPEPHSCMCACAKETSSFWSVQKHLYGLLTECCKQISRFGPTYDSIYLFRPSQLNPKLFSSLFLECFRILSGPFGSFRVLWIIPHRILSDSFESLRVNRRFCSSIGLYRGFLVVASRVTTRRSLVRPESQPEGHFSIATRIRGAVSPRRIVPSASCAARFRLALASRRDFSYPPARGTSEL